MTKPFASSTDNIAASNGRGAIHVSPLAPHVAGSASPDHLPPLARDASFWGMTATQFFGAFNDGLFKQLVLLLATPTEVQAANGVKDRQGWAQFIFALAFLMFSGFAGYVSD